MTTPATANCTFFVEDFRSFTEDEIVVSKGDTHHAVITHHYTGAVAFDVITTEEARALYPKAYNVNGEYFEGRHPDADWEINFRIHSS